MPTYDYDCPKCGGFDAIRSLSARNDCAACPECGTASNRVMISAPRLRLMADGTRTAMATNERAQHEPGNSGEYPRMRHPPGCGCCSTSRIRNATVTASNGNKAFPTKRPWMISH